MTEKGAIPPCPKGQGILAKNLMKYSQTQLEEMPDLQLDRILAEILGTVEKHGYFKNCDFYPQYCKRPNDIIPLAREYEINILFDYELSGSELPTAVKGTLLDDIYGAVSGFDYSASSENYLRAIVIVLIMLLQKNN